jgi:hypothetical protein
MFAVIVHDAEAPAMRDAETAMCAYAQLAWLSHEKRQALARDRFLILAGAAACEAGWPNVATECHRLVTGFAPQHQLAGFASFTDAMKSDDFQKLLQSVTRHCPFERAEHLLQGVGRSPQGDDPDLTRGDWVTALLTRPEWNAGD